MKLAALTILPAILIIYMVYRMDKLEKEPKPLIKILLLCGVGSTFLTLLLGAIPNSIMDMSLDENSVLYNVLRAFVMAGLIEETSKYIMLRIGTYKKRAFNCLFDGIVYAVTVSMGFALFENILYVLDGGWTTAILRALTAVPGHACDAIFMGFFYGYAKKYQILGDKKKEKKYTLLSILSAAIVHGIYDCILMVEFKGQIFVFIAFIIILYISCIVFLKKASKNDEYIDNQEDSMYNETKYNHSNYNYEEDDEW